MLIIKACALGIRGIFDYAIFLALRGRFILEEGGRYNLKGCGIKKSVILNLELGKVVKNGYKVVRCPKFPSRRTSSGDVTYHFKASGRAVNITIDFMI